jgi:chromosomal replication initiation ATPase DnaA
MGQQSRRTKGTPMTVTVITCRRCGYVNKLNSSLGDDLTDRIVNTAGDLFAVDPAAIMSRSQRQRVANVRAAVFAVMRNDLQMSYPDIGATMDRDHSTVMHAVRRCDPAMMEQLANAVRSFLPIP